MARFQIIFCICKYQKPNIFVKKQQRILAIAITDCRASQSQEKFLLFICHLPIKILSTQRILIYDAKVPSPAEILTRNQGARFDGGSLRHISLVFCSLV